MRSRKPTAPSAAARHRRTVRCDDDAQPVAPQERRGMGDVCRARAIRLDCRAGEAEVTPVGKHLSLDFVPPTDPKAPVQLDYGHVDPAQDAMDRSAATTRAWLDRVGGSRQIVFAV